MNDDLSVQTDYGILTDCEGIRKSTGPESKMEHNLTR